MNKFTENERIEILQELYKNNENTKNENNLIDYLENMQLEFILIKECYDYDKYNIVVLNYNQTKDLQIYSNCVVDVVVYDNTLSEGIHNSDDIINEYNNIYHYYYHNNSEIYKTLEKYLKLIKGE
jgi:hypothetical protein